MPDVLIAPVGADNPEAPAFSPSLLAALVLEAALRQAEIPADIFFYFDERWPTARERLLAQAAERRYRVIGLSFMSYNRIEAYELLRDLERVSPESRIIVGGVHATFLYEQLLRAFPMIRAAAIGEGEEAMVGFSRHPDDLASIPGIAWRDPSGAVRVNPPAHGDRRSLDETPIPAFERLLGCTVSIPIQTTRGCVGRCSFCAWKALEPVVKTKSTQRILAEWARIRELFGPDRTIDVMDALYNVSLRHVKDMCRALTDAGFTSNHWDVEIRAKPVDLEMLQLMKQAGCRRIMVGVESGNEQIRRQIGKAVSSEEIRRVFALAREARLPALAFVITGLPGETDASVAETIEFVKSLKPFYAPTTVAPQLYPGSELYETARRRGQISDAYWLHRHPKNFGDLEAFGNMPLFTVEANLVQLIRWCSHHNHEGGMLGRCLPFHRIVMTEDEYDRLDPWREGVEDSRVGEFVNRKPRGTWKGRARRIVRGIRSRLEIAPRRPQPTQPLAVSMSVRAHRPADVYLLVVGEDNRAASLLLADGRLSPTDALTPFCFGMPGQMDCYWTLLFDSPEYIQRPGRYSLLMVVCGTRESFFDRGNWLDWHRITFEILP